MSNGHYVLDADGNAVEEASLLKWAEWYEHADRQVALTIFRDMYVSTIFLGIDHRFPGNGPPLLFETMIFGGKHNEYQVRSSLIEEAKLDHAEAVAIMRNLLPAYAIAD